MLVLSLDKVLGDEFLLLLETAGALLLKEEPQTLFLVKLDAVGSRAELSQDRLFPRLDALALRLHCV